MHHDKREVLGSWFKGSGDLMAAIYAPVSLEMILKDPIIHPFNDEFAAYGTTGVLRRMACDISQIDVCQASLKTDLSDPLQFGSDVGGRWESFKWGTNRVTCQGVSGPR